MGPGVSIQFITDYLGESYDTSNNEVGTTYILDFDYFSLFSSKVEEAGTCSNRLSSSYVNKSFSEYWYYSNDQKIKRILPMMKMYSSRQQKKPIFREDTGLASASRASLWRKGKRIGDKVKIYTNEDSFSHIDIHTLEDLKLAEAAKKIRKIK